jgi:uncharacterized membrane protein YeaQ/YmgE (transglycosylase-associated protein family)
MGIISWVVWGLFVGVVARLLLPGKQNLGVALTIVFGIAGSIVGGLVATQLLDIGDSDDFDFGSFIIAVVGSVALLGLYQLVNRRVEKREGDDQAGRSAG